MAISCSAATWPSCAATTTSITSWPARSPATATGVVINARLIQADSGVIVSSGQAFLNNRDLNYILSDANRGAVEKVVVERNVVPPLKPNTVFIR